MTFKKEFKKQFRFAITAAVGFLIAFAWRDVIFNSSLALIQNLTQITNLSLSILLTAVFLTIVGVAIIFLTSKLLKD